MTKAELFALFGEYDVLRTQALSRKDIFDRAEELDLALESLLNALAQAAK